MIDRRQFLLPLASAAALWPAGATARSQAARTGAGELDGLWTNASYTQLQRPDAFKSLTATEAEATAWEAKLAKTGGVNVREDPVGQATSEFPETGAGLARIRGQIRTSLIVDPPDGKLPYTAEARRALRIGEHDWRGYDDPEQRPLNERCLVTASTGPPILSSADANVLQILQTPEHLVILTEKYHDARIIRLSSPPAPRGPPSWFGQSEGRWEGATLVAITDNLLPRIVEHGDELYLSGQSRIVERFTRIAPTQIFYEFEVTDPSLYSRPWRAELVFNASPAPLYEYACHEGNYSIVNILAAARLGRQGKAAATEAAKAQP